MDRDQALADYLSGLTTLRDIALADPTALRRVPESGWSAAWQLHHLADAEVVSAERLRRILAEDSPTLVPFDQDNWSLTLHYDSRDAAESAAVVVAIRESNVRLLAALDDEQWQRVGIHQVNGAITVEQWMRSQTAHLGEHVSAALEAIQG